jgi:SAM-dependent methyltransferase
MDSELQKIIEHENAHWSEIFKIECEKNNDKNFSSFWWEDYYNELSLHVNNLVDSNNLKTILEAGSGSGKATILLDKKISKTLLDISPNALKYAKKIANKHGGGDINFVEGNIFSMLFKDENFDLVWNIGVVEHYELENVKSIIGEMIRVCSKSGIVAVGLPNFYSGSMVKARLLKKVKFIPGYKIDTEKFHSIETLNDIFRDVSKDMGRNIAYIKTECFGNPMFMETPKFLLKIVGGLVSRIFKNNKFLILIICKFE